MAKKIYPGFPPSYKKVNETGGYARQCLVVELLSLDKLDDTQLAIVRERIEATLAKLQRDLPIVEKTQVVLQAQFDKLLRDGLRL